MVDYIRFLVAAYIIFFGLRAFKNGEIRGRSLGGSSPRIYNKSGNPYWVIKGKAAYVIGILTVLGGLFLIFDGLR